MAAPQTRNTSSLVVLPRVMPVQRGNGHLERKFKPGLVDIASPGFCFLPASLTKYLSS